MTVDPRTFRLAVTFLGVALLACIAGIIVLTALHDPIPDVLATIVGVVGGALAGLFVTPHSDTPTPVTVTDQPVAVTDAPPKTTRRRKDAGFTDAWLLIALLVIAALVLGAGVSWWFLLLLVLVVLVLVRG